MRGKQGKQSSSSSGAAALLTPTPTVQPRQSRPGQWSSAEQQTRFTAWQQLYPYLRPVPAVAISLEGSKIRRAILGNGSRDRPLQHYATAKQSWQPGPLDIGDRGWWQGRSIWTRSQGAQPYRSPLVFLPRMGHCFAQLQTWPSRGIPPPKGSGWILTPRLAGKRWHLQPLRYSMRPGQPWQAPTRSALCPQTSAAPTWQAGPRLGFLGTRVHRLQTVQVTPFKERGEARADGHNTLLESRHRTAQGNSYPCPQQSGLLQVLTAALL